MSVIRFAPFSRTTRRAITLGVLAFVVLLGFGLAEAHCAEVAKPAALYLSLSAADLGSTAIAMHNPGVTEGNAFMSGRRLEKQLAVAVALTAADVQLQRSGHPRGAKALRIAVTVVRFAAIAVNLHNVGQGQ